MILLPLRSFVPHGIALLCAALLMIGFADTARATAVADLVAERAVLDLGVEMPATGRFEVMMPGDAPTQGVMIREFWIDHQTGQFIANLVTQEGGLRRISGLAILKMPVPVTRRRLLPDEIITAEDIEITELPWQRVHAFAVLEPRDLIGKQVKRLIAQGRPVQLQSVIPPIVIARGDEVKIELRHGALQLITTGKAISDAHLGQEVRVVNLSSNKTIIGIARGDGIVEARN
ncbi:flagellar basal body P-ring formation chaperone FlgA [Aestuariivita sp.]|jgi:flagella basal body P-ring formation protein FlgA|uniref:flagellar basal body P-ring formation chaperone FlgA n=1 Tax=Aestuariivita sp. TaxID=1872407 RepID=UPI002172A34B|nr:flagellar basal body P-ring formation chaperone FlgA [Aestuariivita sp.]MCE8008960.1 flagellar basal body P-ring formation protein FlgA [Aestuariivita sp.]